jgi:hypothetical protein
VYCVDSHILQHSEIECTKICAANPIAHKRCDIFAEADLPEICRNFNSRSTPGKLHFLPEIVVLRSDAAVGNCSIIRENHRITRAVQIRAVVDCEGRKKEAASVTPA